MSTFNVIHSSAPPLSSRDSDRIKFIERRIANLKKATVWLKNPEDKRRARSLITQHRTEIETIKAEAEQ